MSKVVNILDDQNIFDVAIQQTGSAEGVFDIIAQNDDITSLDHVFQFGDVILIDDTNPRDKFVLDFYNTNGVVPSSGEENILGDYNDDYNDDYLN